MLSGSLERRFSCSPLCRWLLRLLLAPLLLLLFSPPLSVGFRPVYDPKQQRHKDNHDDLEHRLIHDKPTKKMSHHFHHALQVDKCLGAGGALIGHHSIVMKSVIPVALRPGRFLPPRSQCRHHRQEGPSRRAVASIIQPVEWSAVQPHSRPAPRQGTVPRPTSTRGVGPARRRADTRAPPYPP
jgi:hypothetical protein